MGGDAISLGWCAVGLLAAALGGRAPTSEVRPEPDPRVRLERGSDARPLGVLHAGARQTVDGHVDPRVPDAREAFALTAESPCLVRYRLTPTLPGTELAVHILDRSRVEVEHGAVAGVLAFTAAGVRRDLEVGSSWGASCYSLELEALPLPARTRRTAR
jgi:hypothetical protein